MPRYNTIPEVNNSIPHYSYLTAIAFAGFRDYKKERRKLIICKCKCGNLFTTTLKTVVKGTCKSCGCLKHLPSKLKTHGMSYNHPLYKVWCSMKKRCNNQNEKSWRRYGGRGIKVCDEWQSDFMAFYKWAVNKWHKGLQIDRINNNGNYHPENCRFVTHLVNSRNKENTVHLFHNGKRMTINEWAKELNIYHSTIRYRYLNGWPVDKILSNTNFSNEKDRFITLIFNGKELTIGEWAKYLSIPVATLWDRYYKGWDVNKILSTEKFKPNGKNQYSKF